MSTRARLRAPRPPRPVPGVTWQPGDPLYKKGSYRDYMANFRDDPVTEDCHCGDAATWPIPLTRALPAGDELGAFIAAVRAEDTEATTTEETL